MMWNNSGKYSIYTVISKKLFPSTAPHRTPSESHDDHEHFDSCYHLPAVPYAHNINQASTTVTELIVSKATKCGHNNHSSSLLTTLHEIPNRISQQNPTTTAIALPDDNDEQCQHQPFSSLPDEIEPIFHPIPHYVIMIPLTTG